uniref:Uncharacterized protein n=1 Tax=Candidatus Methanogaster sp. ANME-2c ERB4 TaxID=2759911 RepID=A0A7G9YAY9_9EURY|nr:hypothetical protein GMDKAGHH_00026 [Methanosarcinales archaeon ANME-2c ERB4]QNO46025.1 hypothetical protein OOGCPJEC_00010 [Methanosarcinales archaeon ANME-2c ERB4]
MATVDIVSLVHVPSKRATFMGTKWLPGSVYSAGFRMNHHKVIDPYYPSRAYMGVGWGLRHPSRIFILMGVPKSHEGLFCQRRTEIRLEAF